MLDKRVAYYEMVMRMDGQRVRLVEEPTLPDGFSFATFQPGDELAWAQVETSVLEFDSVSDALSYFTRSFMPYPHMLRERCLFVLDAKRRAVATATAWRIDGETRSWCCLHWVAVRPEYQGLGLGRAVVAKALRRFADLHPDEDVWLHTQTWSHRAVRLYRSLGFYLVRQESLPSLSGGQTAPNEFDAAIVSLRGVLPDSLLQDWIDTAR